MSWKSVGFSAKSHQNHEHPQIIMAKTAQIKKSAVIRTRPISQAAFPAVKNHTIQRGSARTICPSKWPNRTAKGGARPTLLPVPTHAPPGRHMIRICLPNTMLVDTPTHSSSHKLSYSNAKSFCVRPCFNANCVAIALEVYVNRDLHIWGI